VISTASIMAMPQMPVPELLFYCEEIEILYSGKRDFKKKFNLAPFKKNALNEWLKENKNYEEI
tara:strand:- start:147 stop:335 length:189 start_codon:yes stop_codon:yes gene_type:complete